MRDSSNTRATVVIDNRRRGEPKIGCDCVQCFGYCMINGQEQARQQFKPRTTYNFGKSNSTTVIGEQDELS
jgi:hypothetical protein